MSRCGRASQLEALVSHELPASLEADLRAHAQSCSRCRHELNWLTAERRLFRQRASREEVALLWKGVAQRAPLPAPRPWGRVLVALAASLLAVVVAGQLSARERPISASASDAAVELSGGVSEALESVGGPSADGLCSRLPEGLGFHCAPAIPASSIATR